MAVEKVLVVDDESSIRSLIREFLGLKGVEVLEAENADAAVPIIRRGGFSVVVCDLRMPGSSWELVCEELAGRAGGPVPVVLISGSGFLSEASERRYSFVQGHLAKPFSLDDLWEQVEGAMKS